MSLVNSVGLDERIYGTRKELISKSAQCESTFDVLIFATQGSTVALSVASASKITESSLFTALATGLAYANKPKLMKATKKAMMRENCIVDEMWRSQESRAERAKQLTLGGQWRLIA